MKYVLKSKIVGELTASGELKEVMQPLLGILSPTHPKRLHNDNHLFIFKLSYSARCIIKCLSLN